MTIDPSAFASGKHLNQRLDSYNPWWGFDEEFSPSGGVDARRQEFIDGVQILVEDDFPLHVFAGPSSADTTSLVHQLIAVLLRPDFQEQYLRNPELRSQAAELVVPDENVLYVPLNDDPIYQLRSAEQLKSVIGHFETHIADTRSPQYVILDDLHTLQRPNKRGTGVTDSWESILLDVIESHEKLRIIGTALSAEAIVERSADLAEPVNLSSRGNIHDVPPLGFEQFLRLRYQDLELAPPGERFDVTAAQQSFVDSVAEDDPDPLVSTLHEQLESRIVAPDTVRREVTNFTTAGGLLTRRLDRAGISIESEEFEQVLRSRGDADLEKRQRGLVDEIRLDIRDAATRLHRLKDVAGPERLYALVAHERPLGSVTYTDLVDVLEVDRRTIRRQYLKVLTQLHLLGGAREYANKRPRSIRLYHRDPGVAAAFGRFDLRDVLRQEPGLAEQLAKSATYDQTVRLSRALNPPADPKRGIVKFWSKDDSAVDFVLKVNGVPIPVCWSYDAPVTNLQRSASPTCIDAMQAFLRKSSSLADEDDLTERTFVSVPDEIAERRRAYVDRDDYRGQRQGDVVVDGEAPFGIVVTNARDALDDGITIHREGPKPIVQIPLWTYLRLAE